MKMPHPISPKTSIPKGFPAILLINVSTEIVAPCLEKRFQMQFEAKEVIEEVEGINH
jgi:hypothetical protein